MAVKDFLSRPRELAAELSRLEKRMVEVRAACTSTTAHWSVTGGGGSHDARERLLTTLVDLGREKAALNERLQTAEQEVDGFLVRLRAQYGLRPYALLRWRCRLRKTWPQVQQGLEEIYGQKVSLRSAQNWYAQAVEQAEELYQKIGPLQ